MAQPTAIAAVMHLICPCPHNSELDKGLAVLEIDSSTTGFLYPWDNG